MMGSSGWGIRKQVDDVARCDRLADTDDFHRLQSPPAAEDRQASEQHALSSRP